MLLRFANPKRSLLSKLTVLTFRLAEWEPTYRTLHMWTQSRQDSLGLAPCRIWWNVALLRERTRGLTHARSPIPYAVHMFSSGLTSST